MPANALAAHARHAPARGGGRWLVVYHQAGGADERARCGGKRCHARRTYLRLLPCPTCNKIRRTRATCHTFPTYYLTTLPFLTSVYTLPPSSPPPLPAILLPPPSATALPRVVLLPYRRWRSHATTSTSATPFYRLSASWARDSPQLIGSAFMPAATWRFAFYYARRAWQHPRLPPRCHY